MLQTHTRVLKMNSKLHSDSGIHSSALRQPNAQLFGALQSTAIQTNDKRRSESKGCPRRRLRAIPFPWTRFASLLRGCLRSPASNFWSSIEFRQTQNDAEQLLCHRPDRFSLRTHLASSSGSAARGSTAHNGCTGGIECDLLFAADRLPMATRATRVSGVGHGLPLLPKLEERGRVDVYSEGSL